MTEQRDASGDIRRLYEALDEHSEHYSSLIANYDTHSVRVEMGDYEDGPDEVVLSGDSLPYLKMSLIDEAVARGDIRQKPETMFADDATITIGDKKVPVEDVEIEDRTESFLYDAK